MSRLTAFLLVSIISFQAFYNAGVLTYWFVNRAYISSVLCENRTRPALHCDGKCYLKKKLIADSPNDAQQLPLLKKGLELAECPARLWLQSLIHITEQLVSNPLPPGNCYCATGFSRAVFHPPA